MNPEVQEMRNQIVEIAALMYSRHLTDTAGGNISARVGDLVCITPRYAGSRNRWQLKPEQILVADLDGHQLEGDGQLSRESPVHFSLLRGFPDGASVIHAHAPDALVFCVTAKSMPPVLEATRKFGEIKVIPFARAHSQELANNIVAAIQGQEAHIKKQAAVVLAPWHGVFALGKDLGSAFDAVERINTNARLILLSNLLTGASFDGATAISEALEEAYRAAA